MVGSIPAHDSVSTAAPMQTAEDAHCERQTVIIFDWDDTLMASSWIDRMGLLQTEAFEHLSAEIQSQFRDLEGYVERCLTAAAKLGRVLIITNAEYGWVEYSARRFMPRLIPLVQNMAVVSARSSYEKFYPGAPLCWKAAAFAHEANQFFGSLGERDDNVRREMISFGDSNEERTAVKIAAGQLGAQSKSVKFVDLPTPEQLAKQVETVTGWLTWVVGHGSELDLMLKASDLTTVEDPTLSTGYQATDLSKDSTPWRPPPMATLDVRE